MRCPLSAGDGVRWIAVTVAFCVLVFGALGERALPLSLTVGTPWRRPPLPASLSGITWAGGTNY